MTTMHEVAGDLWDWHDAGLWLVVTTNGDVNRRGMAIMGRGVAAQAALRYPALPELLAERLKEGNYLNDFWPFRLITFPVKHHWHDTADLELIERSCQELVDLVTRGSLPTPVVLPRPGCGNGGLDWAVVRPVVAALLDDRFVVVERG